MASSPVATNSASTSAAASTACRAAIQSRQSTIEHHQARPAASAFRHGRIVHDQPNRATLTSLGARRLLLPSSIGLNWRDSAFNRRVSPFYSACSGSRLRTHLPRQLTGSRPVASQTLGHQKLVNAVADVPATHRLVPFSSVRCLCSHNASRRGQGRGHIAQHLDHSNQELGTSIQAGGCND